MRQLNAIIVDDEHLAREGLVLKLKSDQRVNVVAQCNCAKQALQAIGLNQPDIVFVDIEMPGISGLELAKQLMQQTTHLPKVVFVTGCSEFAINAFEYQAFDYLLKPFSNERLNKCLTKLVDAFFVEDELKQHHKLNELLTRKTGNSIDGLIKNLEISQSGGISELQHCISLKSGTEWLRIKLDNILWIEAAGDYMCVHTLDGPHIIRQTLKQLEQELDPKVFPRVNRSAMINLAKLQKLTPNSNGELIAKLYSGDEIKISRKYKFRIEALCNTVKSKVKG